MTRGIVSFRQEYHNCNDYFPRPFGPNPIRQNRFTNRPTFSKILIGDADKADSPDHGSRR